MPTTEYNAIESPDSSRTDTQTSSREIVAKRLEEAGLSPDRFIRLQDGSKAPISHDTHPPEQIGHGNYGVYAGYGLVIVDIDDYREGVETLPETVDELPDTFTVSSPHDGEHRYYAVSADVSNAAFEWGDVQAVNKYVVSPGSQLKRCQKNWHDCSGTQNGYYRIKRNQPIATVSASEFPTPRSDNRDIDTEYDDGTVSEEDPEYDESVIDVANIHLRTLQSESGNAFHCLIDRLKGGRGRLSGRVTRDDGTIDRSSVDFVTLSHLYGVMTVFGGEDESRAKELAYAVYSHYGEQNPYVKDKTGKRRKWLLRDEKYRQDRLAFAGSEFDRGKFLRWVRKGRNNTNEWRGWSDDYSDTTYDTVRFALNLLSGVLPVDYGDLSTDSLRDIAHTVYGFDVAEETLQEIISLNHTPLLSKDSTPLEGCISPSDYPKKRDVIEVARRLDEGHNKERTYEEALRRLRRDGVATMACLKEGVDYRYYPHGVPDPKDAEWVKTNSVKRAPEQFIE